MLPSDTKCSFNSPPNIIIIVIIIITSSNIKIDSILITTDFGGGGSPSHPQTLTNPVKSNNTDLIFVFLLRTFSLQYSQGHECIIINEYSVKQL